MKREPSPEMIALREQWDDLCGAGYRRVRRTFWALFAALLIGSTVINVWLGAPIWSIAFCCACIGAQLAIRRWYLRRQLLLQVAMKTQAVTDREAFEEGRRATFTTRLREVIRPEDKAQ